MRETAKMLDFPFFRYILYLVTRTRNLNKRIRTTNRDSEEPRHRQRAETAEETAASARGPPPTEVQPSEQVSKARAGERGPGHKSEPKARGNKIRGPGQKKKTTR